jgi:TRAP-type uncharacterized transport system fused permease subunit
LAIITATLGTTAVGVSMVGYFVRPVGWIKRVLFALGGIGLLIPPGGTIAYSWAVSGASGALCLALIVYEWHARKVMLVPEKAVTAS